MLLRMEGICKAFPGVDALVDVDFELRPGEVHALAGQNGAGKSTLIKVLTGVYRPDRGRVVLESGCGISTVYQEIELIAELSVAENVSLGRLPTRYGFVDW